MAALVHPEKMHLFESSRKAEILRYCSISLATLLSVAALAGCGGGGSSTSAIVTPPPPPPPPPSSVVGPAWLGYARDAQHSALGSSIADGGVAAQDLGHIVWEAKVDLAQASTGEIHYGSPLISSHNTVVLPVKTQLAGSFKVEARSGSDGALLWSTPSDYILPAHRWTPSFGPTLTASNRMYMPAAGGKIIYRDSIDTNAGTAHTLVFYGASAYAAAPASFDTTVFINTPITADSNGTVYFGFRVTGTNPAGLLSGFARITSDGVSSYILAKNAAALTVAVDTAMNSAPALSRDGKTLYVSVRAASTTFRQGAGYLLALDSTTLETKNKVLLLDPSNGNPAYISDDATSSPVIGPDGDVFYGVLETIIPDHNDRGWLLHFDASLSTSKIPGSFGWDDTPSIVPVSMVPSYTGASSYLILSKYNNYADFSAGDGKNKLAILDPNQTQADALLGTPVMKEVMTLLGVTSDMASHPDKPGSVKEWCINTAAVDPITRSVFANSEDGTLYRWDLSTGQISQKIWLDSGYGQAYTPTALGPDGTVYSVNNGVLFAIRK